MWNILRKKEHPYLFLKRWGRIWRYCVWTRWFWKRERGIGIWIVKRCEGKWKYFETYHKKTLIMQNTWFSWLNQVMNKSPGQVAKHLRDKIFENFSKCFLQLEGPPASKSRREPQKFLYNLATGASTHEQVAKLSRENFKNSKFWKIF